jgi:cytochrome c553
VRPLITATIVVLLLLTPARSEQPTDAVRPEQWGLSQLMIEAQLLHIKLWFAGKFGNWRLAAYELDQIAANLGQAAARLPAAASRELIEAQLSILRKAIEEKDVAGFIKGYTELTHWCNACHRAIGRDFISVQIPLASPFTDQAFPDQVAEGRTLAYTVCATCHVIPDQTKVAPAGVAAPSFADLVRRPSFSDDTLRQLLGSGHRRVGHEQAMLNPHLNENQIEQIVAYFEVLKAGQSQ